MGVVIPIYLLPDFWEYLKTKRMAIYQRNIRELEIISKHFCMKTSLLKNNIAITSYPRKNAMKQGTLRLTNALFM